jgi:hypothetical protein
VLAPTSLAQAPPTSPSFPGQQVQPKSTASFQSIGAGLTGLELGAVDFGDFDMDGDQDLVTVGLNSNNRPTTIVYENDGSGSFTALGAGLEGVKNSDAAWVDFDGDGDDDLIISGTKLGGDATTVVYESKLDNGNRVFEEVLNSGLPDLKKGSISAGTFANGDSNVDLLLTGKKNDGSFVTAFYPGNGDGTFGSAIDVAGDAVWNSSSAVLDAAPRFALVTGAQSDGNRVALLNEFGVAANSIGTGVAFGSSSWIDYDGDNDYDILITGEDGSGNHTATLYANDGSNNFSPVSNLGLTGVSRSSSDVGDVDDDGDPDIVITGEDTHGQRFTTVYRNDDGGTFTPITAGLTGVRFGDAAFGNIDGDDELELVVLGDSPNGAPSTKIYEGADTQCPKEWSLAFNVTDGSNTTTLTLGQADAATAGIDAVCGEDELPPPFPGSGSFFDARFTSISGTSVSLGNGTENDFRPADQVTGKTSIAEAVWKFEVSGSSIDVQTFSFTDFPASGYDVRIVDAATNGSALDEAIYDNGSNQNPTVSLNGISTVEIRVTEAPPPSVSAQIELDNGFNLVSLPIQLNDMSWGAVKSIKFGANNTAQSSISDKCSSAFEYNPGSGYSTLSDGDNLVAGKGYVFNCSGIGTPPAPVGLSGQTIDTKTVSVSSGWNIVGVFDQDIQPENVAASPQGALASDFFAFDPANGLSRVNDGDPGTGDPLSVGSAYWVNIGQSGTLEMDPTTPKSAPAATQQRAPLADAAQLTLSDAAGHRATLHLAPGLSSDVLSRFELPPQLPGSVFDVRFDNGTRVAPLAQDGSRQTLNVQGTQGPITLRASGLPSGQTVYLAAAGGSFEERLGADAPTAQVPAGVKALDVTVRSTPTQTRLAKTYPNPASSQATIEFALDSSSDVTVAVYDVLGRQVATLVDGRKQAGLHRASVDASTLESGVYFVRMRAGGTTQTQRLTVVK